MATACRRPSVQGALAIGHCPYHQLNLSTTFSPPNHHTQTQLIHTILNGPLSFQASPEHPPDLAGVRLRLRRRLCPLPLPHSTRLPRSQTVPALLRRGTPPPHLIHSLRLISRWVPRPPDRTQVDRALKTVLSRRVAPEEEITLGEAEFKEFAVEVFTYAVVSSAGREVLKRVPLGAAGIAGFGVVVKPGKEVVVAAIGAYALGVATSIFLSLDS
ncbi:UNVERIFIED_CONTAM: hypothetical protein Sradi_3552100 [Sesamum radiatum]|uniref:Uncharacterized protein n=1 Tax=Sesamum radiatum TaxID=300843 RepID=A0AAW2QFH3_SESRA